MCKKLYTWTFVYFFKVFVFVEKPLAFVVLFGDFRKRFSVSRDSVFRCECLPPVFLSGLCVRLKKPATTESKQTNFFSFIRKSGSGYFGSGFPFVGARKSLGKTSMECSQLLDIRFLSVRLEFPRYPRVCAFPLLDTFLFTLPLLDSACLPRFPCSLFHCFPSRYCRPALLLSLSVF